MPTISDYLLQTTSTGVTSPRVGVWVRFTNNVTAAQFVSIAPTDTNGAFTLTAIPAGSYTVATGPASIGPFTNTGDGNYYIGTDAVSTNVFTAQQTIKFNAGINFQLLLDTLATGNNAAIALASAGTNKWFLSKDSANDGFSIFNSATARTPFHLDNATDHVSLGAATPTLGALQTGISAQTLGGVSNDQRGFVTLTTTASPPAVGATICLINFAGTWAAAPIVIVADSSGGGADANARWSAQSNTTVLTIFAASPLTASKQYTISYWAIG